MSLVVRKQYSGFPTRSDTNQAVELLNIYFIDFIYTIFKEGSAFSCTAILPCGPL